MFRKSQKSNAGFTLIELLVVISIISILSSVVLSTIHVTISKSRDARRIDDFKQIQLALELFKDDFGRYPNISEIDTDLYDFDYSSDNFFLQILIDRGYLSSTILDPINSGGNPWDSNSRVYAYGATSNGEYYMLMTQFDTPEHPLSARYRCDESRWTGGWSPGFGRIIYPGCCPPYSSCTNHLGVANAYIINSSHP